MIYRILISISILCLNLDVFAQITIQDSSISVKDVFEEIKKQSLYRFVYKNEILDGTINVSLNFKNAKVETILRKCFDEQPVKLEFKIDEWIIGVKRVGNILGIAARTSNHHQFTGKVVDERGSAVPDVIVTGDFQGDAVVTDEQGKFKIPSIKRNTTLKCSHGSYVVHEINIKDLDSMVIKLVPRQGTLDEVQEKAYGSTSKRLSPSVTGVIRGSTLQIQHVDNIQATLRTGTPGITVIQNSGIPGSMYYIRVRGGGFMEPFADKPSPNNPLFVIDGVPLASGNFSVSSIQSGTAFGQGGISPLLAFNMYEVQSIEILKDADNTGIFGTLGGNGVILLTTKKGRFTKKGKDTIDFFADASIQFSKVYIPGMLNTDQFLDMQREAAGNDNKPVDVTTIPELGLDNNRYTNLPKLFIGKTVPAHMVQAGFSGGTYKTRYLVSANYYRTGSVFSVDLPSVRKSVHVEGGYLDSGKLALDFTILYTDYFNRTLSADLTNSINFAPNALLNDYSGKPVWQENDIWYNNPWATTLRPSHAHIHNLFTSSQISYFLNRYTTFKLSGGYHGIWNYEKAIEPSLSQNPQYNNDPPGNAYFGYTRGESLILEPQFQYKNTFNIGTIDMLLGGTFQHVSGSSHTIAGTDFPNDNSLMTMSAAGHLDTSIGEITRYKYAAFFGRISYNLDYKFLMNVTVRTDGSSRYGSNKQFRYFGSVGVCWIFVNGGFTESKNSFISYGKLRGSYGKTGNDIIPDYKSLFLWSQIPSQYGSGLVPEQPANANYGWQLIQKMEGGLDLGFFKNRLLVFITGYINRCSNQLLPDIMAATAGYANAPLRNFDAVVRNSGIELMIETQVADKKNFSWNISLDATFPRSKLVFFKNLELTSYAKTFIVGQPLTVRKGFHYVEVDPATGYFKFEDLNGDNRLDSLDTRIIGNYELKYYGSIRNKIVIKNFQIDFTLQVKVQKTLSLAGEIYTAGQPGTEFLNQFQVVLDRWQKPGDIASFQKFSRGGDPLAQAGIEKFRTSDGMFGNGSFIRLVNFSVRFKVPKSWLGKSYIKESHIYIEGQNLLTITGYKGPDPEYNPYRSTLYSLPFQRTVAFGIRINF